MNLFSTIRNAFGTIKEIPGVVIQDEQGNNLTADQIELRKAEALEEVIELGKEDLQKAIENFDEIDQEFESKIQACDQALVKSEGNEEIQATKQILQEKRSKNEDKFINKVAKFHEGIEKAEKELGELIEKGGEGSRGGKVIGHTRSGKPIYDKANHSQHNNFTREDHKEAAAMHSYKADYGRKEERNKHRELQGAHEKLAKIAKKDTENRVFQIDGEDRQGNLFTVEARGKDVHEALKNARKSGRSGEKYYHQNSQNQKESEETTKSDILIDLQKSHNLDLQSAERVYQLAEEIELSKGGIGSGRKRIKINSPNLASHSELHGKTYDVHNESEHEFSTGKKKYYHIEDEKGRKHEIREDFAEIEKAKKKVEIPKDEFIEEHKNLVKILEEDDDEKQKKEAKKQKKELSNELKKAEGDYVAIIYTDHEGKLLLMKREDNGQYMLAGGHIENGETPALAARREFKEETNIDIDRSAYLVPCYTKTLPSGQVIHGYDLKFYQNLGTSPLANIDLENEAVQFKFMTTDEWMQADLFKDTKQHLMEYFEIDNGNTEEISKAKKSFNHTSEQLAEHAQRTSNDILHKMKKHKNVAISNAAKREIELRLENKKKSE